MSAAPILTSIKLCCGTSSVHQKSLTLQEVFLLHENSLPTEKKKLLILGSCYINKNIHQTHEKLIQILLCLGNVA